MAECNSVRKRKRPPYLDEFFASLTGEEPVAKKKIAGKGESEQDCELCRNITESSAIVWDLLAPTGASKNTLSDVLNTLFTEEQLPATVEKPDFSDGYLCKVCKDLVSDLDRLQNETIAVKTSIISVFKKAKRKEKKREGKSAEPVHGKTKVEQKDTEESLVIEKIPRKETKIKKKAVPSNKFNANQKPGLNLTEKPKRKRKVAIIEKEGHKYLVRWENFPESEDTWELRSSIPVELIWKYEEDLDIPNKSVEVRNASGRSNAVNSPGVKYTKKTKYEDNIDKKKKFATKQKGKSNEKPENHLDISKMKRKKKEAIIDKMGHKYLIRWENFPEEKDTWELRSAIPEEIFKKYEEGLEITETPVRDILTKSVEVHNASGRSNVVNSPGVKDTKKPKYEDNIDKKKKFETKQTGKSNEKPENHLDISKTKRKKKEAIIDKKGHRYLIRWENFPEEKDTWELRSAIPEEILKKYEEGLEITATPVREQNTHKTEKGKALKKDKNQSSPKTGKRKSSSSQKEDGIIEALQEKKGSRYLVKWENCPDKESTWEPRSLIPDFILKYYEEDLSRLGRRAPVEEVGEDDENEFVVEAILEKRTSRKGRVEFLIKWKYYEKDEDNTWEPTSNIEKHMIVDFEKNEEKIKKRIIEAENSGQKRRSVRFSMENTEIEKDLKPNKYTRKSAGKQEEDSSEESGVPESEKTLKKRPSRKEKRMI